MGYIPKNTAVISFYDPPGKHGDRETAVDYKGKVEKLFQVAVHDIDMEVLEDFEAPLEDFEERKLSAYLSADHYPKKLSI